MYMFMNSYLLMPQKQTTLNQCDTNTNKIYLIAKIQSWNKYKKYSSHWHTQVNVCLVLQYMQSINMHLSHITHMSMWVICSWVLIVDIHREIILNVIHVMTSRLKRHFKPPSLSCTVICQIFSLSHKTDLF